MKKYPKAEKLNGEMLTKSAIILFYLQTADIHLSAALKARLKLPTPLLVLNCTLHW